MNGIVNPIRDDCTQHSYHNIIQRVIITTAYRDRGYSQTDETGLRSPCLGTFVDYEGALLTKRLSHRLVLQGMVRNQPYQQSHAKPCCHQNRDQSQGEGKEDYSSLRLPYIGAQTVVYGAVCNQRFVANPASTIVDLCGTLEWFRWHVDARGLKGGRGSRGVPTNRSFNMRPLSTKC